MYGLDIQLNALLKKIKFIEENQSEMSEEFIQFGIAYIKMILEILLLNRGHPMGHEIIRKIDMIFQIIFQKSKNIKQEKSLQKMIQIIFSDFD